jgi:RNA polymerase sigma-70 factor (ECF subfamily)
MLGHECYSALNRVNELETTKNVAAQARPQDPAAREAALTRAAVAGSFAAFEELVYLFERRIYGFVFQTCRNEADAKEITQDTFVRAFQALDRFDLKYSFGPWLFAIARRKCVDFFRAQQRAYVAEFPEPADVPDPSRILCEREDRESLWALARQKLGRLEFEVLWLRYAEEMDVRDIARVVRKTRTHVKVSLFRARKSLAREIEPRQTGIASAHSDTTFNEAGAARNPTAAI